eukprot:9234818-Pyramimonas_sp.AAC.1
MSQKLQADVCLAFSNVRHASAWPFSDVSLALAWHVSNNSPPHPRPGSLDAAGGQRPCPHCRGRAASRRSCA